MRLIFGITISLLVLLQYSLWFSENSLPNAWELKRQVNQQTQENMRLAERNRLLDADVLNLKNGLDVVEEKARLELGMIKQGETFYHVIKPAK